MELLIKELSTPARWNKAIQHLRERGEIEDSPRDIGKILKEVQVDVFKEETDHIKDRLFEWAKGHISRGVIQGFPEYYKDQLLKLQFQ